MKLLRILVTAVLSVAPLTGCTPALTPDAVNVALSTSTTHVVAGAMASVEVKVTLQDKSNSETFEVVLLDSKAEDDESELTSLEGQGELVAPIDFVAEAGLNAVGVQIRNKAGQVLAESSIVEIEAIDPARVELAFENPPKKWLINNPISFKLKSNFDLETPGTEVILETFESNKWKKVSAFGLDLKLIDEFQSSSEVEKEFRVSATLAGEPLKSSEGIAVFFQSAEAMLASLAYQSQQAAQDSSEASMAFREAATYPNLYDYSKSIYAQDWKRYGFKEHFVVVSGTVRPDPSWILTAVSCQINFRGETPPGETFIFDSEWFSSDKYNNKYDSVKTSIHGTFIDGEMWLYLAPCSD